MKQILVLAAFALVGCVAPVPIIGTEPDVPTTGAQEAAAAFDGQPNGLVDADTFQADLDEFDNVELVADGLGPVYNAQSCRECHQNPQSGGGSQVAELRAGHRDARGRFQNPRVPIARGKVVIEGRTLINDRAICPSGAFPDEEIQERVPDSEDIRTFRLSINLLGDGFVETVADDFLRDLAARQCKQTLGRICGRVIQVPVLEAPGTYRVGRFGWKNQQASLLSFSADAYLNEMGITSRLQPTEVTTICDTVADPEDNPPAEPSRSARAKARAARSVGRATAVEQITDIDRFTRFMRATKAPPRDAVLARTEAARSGSARFDRAGCATCHVRTLVTAPEGTPLNGGAFAVPAALGNRLLHPFGDFLLHDIGTSDGIAIAVQEHHGIAYVEMMRAEIEPTASRMRTAPLWGVRMRSRLMHDGQSVTLRDAILRHAGEANDARRRFLQLTDVEQQELLTFLQSL